MTALSRVRVQWSGFVGGPGISTFYFLDTATALESLATLYGALAGSLPTDVQIGIIPSGDIIEDTTGALVGQWSGSPQNAIQGTDLSKYSAPSGYQIRWQTSTVLFGHRVRGRTFIVPATSGVYDTDGSLTPAFVTATTATVGEFVASQSSSFVIWSRPFAGSPAVAGRPARAAHAGGHALVTGSSVPDKAAVLRSRRD